MQVVSSLTTVLECAYASAANAEEWLGEIQREVSQAFGGHLGAQVFTMRATDDAIAIDAIVTHDPRAATMLKEQAGAVDAHIVAAMRSGPVHRTNRVIGSGNHPVRDCAERFGCYDTIGAVGYADAQHGCIASFQIDSAAPSIPRGTWTALARLAAHLGAAYRLRIAPQFAEDGDAVLTPKGALVHASSHEPVRSRSRLRDAALSIARAKRESAEAPTSGLAFWTAMVAGQWTLVERTDSDGKRFLIARRNAPGTHRHPALSARERSVLERASYGSSLRFIAYELGLAESTVSETLNRAMTKLGIRSRSELIELYGAIVGKPPT